MTIFRTKIFLHIDQISKSTFQLIGPFNKSGTIFKKDCNLFSFSLFKDKLHSAFFLHRLTRGSIKLYLTNATNKYQATVIHYGQLYEGEGKRSGSSAKEARRNLGETESNLMKCRVGGTEAQRERLYIMDQGNLELVGPETASPTSFQGEKKLMLRDSAI